VYFIINYIHIVYRFFSLSPSNTKIASIFLSLLDGDGFSSQFLFVFNLNTYYICKSKCPLVHFTTIPKNNQQPLTQ
jgi:hypothetical protein